ncbi:MAG: FKBP-type peptidyl-prolyl cis-trans isomerase [Nitrospira sp.]|nr:MAG: FKBP-type peptidyl-prolyl cis-trans isomerase [Nitrospira sp.]
MSASRMSKLQTHDLAVRRVRVGDTVRVDFLAWSEEGTLVDSSLFGEPLVFTIGQHTVMRGVEKLVIGMTVGESRTEQIPPDLAFGPYRPELSCQVSRSWLEAQGVVPIVGLGLDVRKKNDTLVRMIITGLDRYRVTLDANHRLAGKSIMVQLDLLEIVDYPNSDIHCA